jgi:hypothetical protein
VGLLIVLALSAIAALAEREPQLGGLGSNGTQSSTQALPMSLGAQSASLRPAPSTTVPAGAKRRVTDAYAKLPLAFIPNAGQIDGSVRYYAQGAGYTLYFTHHKVVLALQKGHRGEALDLRFLGVNPNAELVAADRASGKVNYLMGSERHTGLPTYGRVIYRDLWPGIDMVFRGKGGRLNYEFRLRPGAKVSDIHLAYAGAEGVSLSRSGKLLIDTPLGTLRDARPQSFQRIDGRRVPVNSRYALAGNSYGFAVGHHDLRRSLVIDPSLAYSTFLGGSFVESSRGIDIAVDSAGAAYLTGSTGSTDFPTTAGAYDTTQNGSYDAFVTKLNPAGSSLAYSTYLGGSDNDFGLGIAVDSAGAAYVTGETLSADFPTTAGAFENSFDAFVTKLNPAGSSLAYSTYLGGSGLDTGYGIAVDSAGAAYVTGTTAGGFPTTAGAFDTGANGNRDAFVTKLDPARTGLAYSTYLGGGGIDQGLGIAVDSAGAAYLTGSTGSTDFPTTAGAFEASYNGGFSDAFVTKLNPAGSGLAYSTYLGGSGGDGSLFPGAPGAGAGIAVDSQGAAYVTGDTSSTDFPTTTGAFDTSFNGGFGDAFVTKLDLAGSGLAYSTYLGGSNFDPSPDGIDIAVDSAGAAYVTGSTDSPDFPTTAGAFDTSFTGANGDRDAFVTKLNPAGSSLAYSTYLGGSLAESGFGIAVDSAGAAYVTGFTGSADFPTTTGAFDTSTPGAFVTKLTFPSGAAATVTLTPRADNNDVDIQHCVTATVKDASGNPTPNITVRFKVTGSVNTSGSATTNSNGEATFCYQGPKLPGADEISAFADNDNNGLQDPGEPSGTATKVWTLPSTTLCSVSQGGQISANTGDKANFGGSAQSDAGGNLKGQESYQDQGPAQPQNVKSTEILALSCSQDRTEATIFGRATINGSGSHQFRIDIQDLGEPGKGKDSYRILLDTGYDSGVQTLEGGNVQIHKG